MLIYLLCFFSYLPSILICQMQQIYFKNSMSYYYNSNCNTQTCSSLCCNYYGSCPNYYSSSSYYNQCWYYYTYYSGSSSCTSTSSTCCYSSSTGYYSCSNSSYTYTDYYNQSLGAIIGGAVGGFVFLVLMIVLTVFLCRKCRQNQIPIQVSQPINSNLPPSTADITYVGQPYQSYQGQPYTGMPVTAGSSTIMMSSSPQKY